MPSVDLSTYHHHPEHSGPIENRASFMMGMEVAMLVITIAATTLRSCLRRRGVGRLRAEDWCCIGATFVQINMVIVHGLGVRYGIGRHIWDLHFTEAEIISSIKTGYVGRILYPFATGLTRQSVLCLLLRIFPYKTFRRIVISMVLINVTISLISCCVVAFQCVPMKATFNPFINQYGPRAGCLDARDLAFAIPACNLILDVTVAFLPVRMILTISLPGRSKAVILGMLGLGAFACVASGMRLFCIHKSFGKLDATWNAVQICLLATAEVTIGIVCVSAPALRPLMKGFKKRKKSVSVSPKSTIATGHRSGTKSSTKTSFALGSLKRPEKTKVRLQMRDDSSVERFRPNDVNRTITEIEAGEGSGYGRSQDETSGDDTDDRTELTAGSHGILRKMEVAVTISDRV